MDFDDCKTPMDAGRKLAVALLGDFEPNESITTPRSQMALACCTAIQHFSSAGIVQRQKVQQQLAGREALIADLVDTLVRLDVADMVRGFLVTFENPVAAAPEPADIAGELRLQGFQV